MSALLSPTVFLHCSLLKYLTIVDFVNLIYQIYRTLVRGSSLRRNILNNMNCSQFTHRFFCHSWRSLNSVFIFLIWLNWFSFFFGKEIEESCCDSYVIGIHFVYELHSIPVFNLSHWCCFWDSWCKRIPLHSILIQLMHKINFCIVRRLRFNLSLISWNSWI